MDYINYIFQFLMIVIFFVAFMVTIKIHMIVANYIGEKLDLGKSIINILSKMKSKSDK